MTSHFEQRSSRTLLFSVLLVCVLLTAATDVLAQTAPEPPVITSLSRNENGGAVAVIGKAGPFNVIDIAVTTSDGITVYTDELSADESGIWRTTINDSQFPVGAYTLRALVRDSAGNVSEPAEARGFKLQPRPIFSINNFDIGWGHIFLLVLAVTLGGAGFFGWMYERARRRRDVYATITERDINNMCTLLSTEVDRLADLLKDAKGLEPHIAAELDYIVKNERATLEKMNGYLSAAVRKIR